MYLNIEINEFVFKIYLQLLNDLSIKMKIKNKEDI